MAYQNHKELDPTGLTHVKTQYNIMALVGNGFDLQVLNEYKQKPTTRYTDFYYHLKMRGVSDENLILGKMQELQEQPPPRNENWSDVERCIADLEDDGADTKEIQSSLKEVQREFSGFLNRVVGSRLLSDLSDDAQENEWSNKSLATFLEDLTEYEELKKIAFGAKKGNYDLFNFFFVNFNYTSLLDNYIHLDSVQFDPHRHKTVGTNFFFDFNPRKLNQDGRWDYESSSNVATQIVHPHGSQDIPRSLLFGTGYSGNPHDQQAQLAKPYWAQNQLKYAHLFDDTHLFIVFGCSLGETDQWWWQNIAQALLKDDNTALMLYWWNPCGEDVKTSKQIQDLFFDAAGTQASSHDKLRQQICVVSYNDESERVWLSTRRPKPSPFSADE
ncbi:ABC transporter permease [Leucobacter coleopterorum]|uniref:ABC transporter permease n=1 Tax=Leucobacter coleopterorum TaxID=2714933 RepID=A0ABX6JZ21_9MICO|nr:AbiH family protein [Leucobacter coleopterorum]QIM19566.1 ABC transporter permease [Leucobacter coleopterorum]